MRSLICMQMSSKRSKHDVWSIFAIHVSIVKAVFTIFLHFVNVEQTRSLIYVQKKSKLDICLIFATHVNPSVHKANLSICFTFIATVKLSQMCFFFLHLLQRVYLE